MQEGAHAASRQRLLPRAKGAISSLGLLSMASNMLMLTGPLYMLQVYDRVLASHSMATLTVLFGLVCALYCAYGLIEVLRSRMMGRYAALMEAELGPRLFRAGVRMRTATPRAAEVEPVRDLDTVKNFLSGASPLALFDLPWLPVYLAIIFMLHPLLGWLATGGAGLLCLVMLTNELLSRGPARRAGMAGLERQVQAEAARSNAEALLAMGMIDTMAQRWGTSSDKQARANLAAADRSALFASITKAFRYLLQSSVLTVGAYLAIRGEVTGGLFIAASIITSRALAPVEQVVAGWKGFVSARQAAQRLRLVLAIGAHEDPATRLPAPKNTLAVSYLATGPYASGRAVAGGFNFSLNAGDALGVVGTSGSGKSSLGRVLVGAWPAIGGDVRLDGATLQQYGESQRGTFVGYLPQRVELFPGTVAQNIARFDPEATSEAVIAAARAAGVDQMVAGLPDGYETVLGEAAAGVSLGQAQRIALARALYGEPFLVVLDEPNANLDAEGNSALLGAIEGARARGAVVIVIAHRTDILSAVSHLLRVEGGRQIGFERKEGAANSVEMGARRVAPVRRVQHHG